MDNDRTGTACLLIMLIGSTNTAIIPSRTEPTETTFPRITSYRQLKKLFDTCGKKTLVLFDIDDTLLTFTDITQAPQWEPWFEIRTLLEHPNTPARHNKDLLWSTLIRNTHFFAFDQATVPMLLQLKRQKSMVIALTALNSGKHGIIDSLAQWRTAALSSFGMNFSGQFDDASFTSLPAHRGYHPCLYRGVLFINGSAKGDVLGAFLDRYHLRPTRIIFFDDRERELRSVAHECARRAIPFLGYQVMAAKTAKMLNRADTTKPLPQLAFLTHYARWLKDAEEIAFANRQEHPRHERHP